MKKTLCHISVVAVGLALLSGIPSLVGHIYIAKYYWLRDAITILGLPLLAWRTWSYVSMPATLRLVILVGAPLMPLPWLLFDRENVGLVVLGLWGSKWVAAFLLGCALAENSREAAIERWLLGGGLAIILAGSFAAGFWEIRHGEYLLRTDYTEQTTQGVLLSKTEKMGDLIRIRGFQRTIGDFAAAMSLGAIWCLGLLQGMKGRFFVRTMLVAILGVILYAVYFSTGRSMIAGCAAAIAAAMILSCVRSQAISRSVIGLALPMGAVVSISGVMIIVISLLSSVLLPATSIGSDESSYMRLEVWHSAFNDMSDHPGQFILGSWFAPLAASLRICDNIYVWMIYHAGLPLAIAWGATLTTMVIGVYRKANTGGGIVLAAFVHLASGGMFTDLMFYHTYLFLLFAIGLASAPTHREMRSSMRAIWPRARRV